MSVSYQTVRLARGKHSGSEQGVCVMELASMLADESFTDRPTCVSPIIGGLLRCYNDQVNSEHRQDLIRFVPEIIGTNGSEEDEVTRERMCMQFGEMHARQVPRRVHPFPKHLGHDAPGVFAVRSLGRITDEEHEAMLTLIEQLVAVGKPDVEPVEECEVEVLQVALA